MRKTLAILTGPRRGGPLQWARNLAVQVNRTNEYAARVIASWPTVLLSQLIPPGDLVHATIPSCLHLWRRPYCLTVKGEYPVERYVWRYLYPWAIRRARAVTVPSDFLRQRVQALRTAEVVPNAVSPEQFTLAALPDRSPLEFVTVSNFWFPDKAAGIMQLVGLLQTLTGGSVSPFSLTIVGDGPYLSQVKKTIRASFPIHFLGWQNPRSLLSTKDVFLYYSYHDNMPNAVLEAMASGLPIIAHEVGALREMIVTGSNGFVARTDDHFRDTLMDVMRNVEMRRRIGRQARQRVTENFSWEVVIPQFLSIYRRIED